MGDLKNIEVGGVQQALVVGQVINRLTQEAISTSLIVDIAVRYPGETLYRPFASPVRVIAAGYFVVSGSPLQVLPLNLAPGDTVEFRLNVASPGYMPLEQFEVVSAASITPASTDVVLAGHNLEVDRVPAVS